MGRQILAIEPADRAEEHQLEKQDQQRVALRKGERETLSSAERPQRG
jgi:hypothetical protein